MIDYFANPSRFVKITSFIFPWLSLVVVTLFVFGIYFALFNSPEDIVQGSAVRIMYVHVPSAWLSLFSYLLLALCSFFFIVWRHPLADILSRSIAPIGAVFALLTLLTGSIWGRPMWGTWWVWDARLTSVLILFFLYLGYIALNNAFDDPVRGAKASAVLALVGAVNLPIIKFSVDWWNTLHQPASVTRLDAPAIHSSMLWPLLLMALGFTLFYVSILILRVRSEVAAARIRNLQLVEARG